MKSALAELEMQELIQKLIDRGYGPIVDCLLSNESKCYTKKDRLNKSATCREMGWKSKQLEDALMEMREVLKKDVEGDEDEEEEETED
jgi:hypothetical protein